MKAVYIFIVALLFICLQSNAQTWQWTHPEPNGNSTNIDNSDEAHNIETDATGSVYVLGDFKDSLFLNNIYRAKGNGSYLAKYDSTGNLLWYKLMIPTSTDLISIKATGLTVTAQGIFVVGKYDKSYNDGNHIYNYSYKIGTYSLTSDINDAGLFLTKFNSNGGMVWNDKLITYPPVEGDYYNGSAIDFSPLITSDKNNNIICAFIYNGPQNRNLSIGANAIPAINYSAYNILVLKMNSAGTLLWSTHAENTTGFIFSNMCHSIIADKNGNIFLYGATSDYCNFGSITYHTNYFLKDSSATYSTFMAKLSSSGVWQFAKEILNAPFYGYTIGNPSALLTVDNNNNVYALVDLSLNISFSYGVIMGDTVATNSDRAKVYLVKVTNAGDLIWHKGFDGYAGNNYANSIQFANNSLYVCGQLRTNSFYNSFIFPNLFVPSPGWSPNSSYIYYVAKANANGDFQWGAELTGPPGGFYQDALAVKAFNGNIYTAGYYTTSITSLGNLNGSYTDQNSSAHNIFFGKLKDQYIRVGVVTPIALIPGCTISIPFTSFGLKFSATNAFTAELSDANGDFTSATVIGNTTSTGSGTITATIPASLTYGDGYRVRIRSSDILTTGYNYYAYADTGYALTLICPAPSSGFTATNIKATSATLNWATVGCAAGYKPQYRANGTTAWTTAPIITTNTPTINLTGLIANTTYKWRVATKCRNNGTNSFSPYTTAKQFTTAATFALNASGADDESESTNGIIVYPNPAKTSATVEFSSDKAGAYVLNVEDVAGKILLQKKGRCFAGKNIIQINLSDFAHGMYLVSIITNGKQIVKLNKE